MESYISFSIISVFFYTFMILTLLAGKRSRIINSFMCVLGGMLCWTLGSFLMRMEAGPSYILWYYVSLAGILFLPYFYYVFISAFMGVRMGRKSRIPLLLMLLLFVINIPGGIILRWPDLIRKNGGAHFVYKITPLVPSVLCGSRDHHYPDFYYHVPRMPETPRIPQTDRTDPCGDTDHFCGKPCAGSAGIFRIPHRYCQRSDQCCPDALCTDQKTAVPDAPSCVRWGLLWCGSGSDGSTVYQSFTVPDELYPNAAPCSQ